MRFNSRRFFSLAMCAAFTSAPVVLMAEEPDAKPAAPDVALKDVFKGHFKVGVAVNRSVTTGQGFRRSEEDVKQDIALAQRHFNHVVAENEMKWQLIHPRAGADGYDFAAGDALIDFGMKNDMEVAGHTLVWHSQTPNWVFEGTYVADATQASDATSSAESTTSSHVLTVAPPRSFGGNAPRPGNPPRPQNAPESGDAAPGGAPNTQGAGQGAAPGNRGPGRGPGGFGGRGGFGGFRGFDLNGPRATREELLERMRDHIHTVVGRYKGKVKVWDVVNEALTDSGDEVLRSSPWSVIIGPDFIAKAFEYAHEADPDAILRYNDYGLENPGKRAKLITLIKHLQEQKIPVMAIGSQAHCNVNTTFETMEQALAEMSALGLPIHITELDVNSASGGQRNTGADVGANSDATQGGLVDDHDVKLAEAYAGIFRAFDIHKDAIDVVTFWGINDAVSWRSRGRPLLFDGSNQPKPAFTAVVEVVTKK